MQRKKISKLLVTLGASVLMLGSLYLFKRSLNYFPRIKRNIEIGNSGRITTQYGEELFKETYKYFERASLFGMGGLVSIGTGIYILKKNRADDSEA